MAHQDVEGEAEAALPPQGELKAALQQPPGTGVEGSPGSWCPLLQGHVVSELCVVIRMGFSAWDTQGAGNTLGMLWGHSRDAPGKA